MEDVAGAIFAVVSQSWMSMAVALAVAMGVAFALGAIVHGRGGTFTNASLALKRGANKEAAAGTKGPATKLGPGDPVLHPLRFRDFTVKRVDQASHDTWRILFELPSANDQLPLPPGRHLTVMANIDGQRVMRPYTPTSHPHERGAFELLVKRYELGAMSTHLCALKPGDKVSMRGPTGNLKYKAGEFSGALMCAAGSGLTPMLQLARYIMSDPDDATAIELLFQNRQERDILLREEIDALVAQHPTRLRVTYFLSNAPDGWDQGFRSARRAGYVARDDLAPALEDPGCKLYVCGPGGFNKSMVGYGAAIIGLDPETESIEKNARVKVF